MRTEGNRSPLQIWTAGFYEFAESTYQAVRDVLDVQQVDFNEYGVDDDGPTPDVQTNNVIVPRSLISLSPNKTPAKAFTPPAEKNIGTRWSFVEKVNE